MIDTVADLVMRESMALVEGIDAPAGIVGKLFKRVYEQGNAVDETDLPIAMLRFEEELSETPGNCYEENTPTLIVSVIIQQPESGHPHEADFGTWHRSVLGELKKAFGTNRTLNGAAVDVRYAGRGLRLIPLEEENPPSSFGFDAAWEIDFRHQIEDPTQQ